MFTTKREFYDLTPTHDQSIERRLEILELEIDRLTDIVLKLTLRGQS